MAYWTVLCKTSAGTEKHFGVTLDTDNNTWVATGPGVDDVFRTKRGPYIVKPAPELATFLLTPASREVVAKFRNLHGASPVDSRGDGQQMETGSVFSWHLHSL